MLKHLKNTANITRTENGAYTYLSTQSDCLDLFATIGALRSAADDEICERFQRAFAEEPTLALKTLFYARDIRGGLGERRVFRTILPYLAMHETQTLRKNMRLVPEYGRWDDLLALIGTPCERQAMRLMRRQLIADMQALAEDGEVSLLAKWLPSENASDEETAAMARRVAAAFGMSPREYRKALTALRARIRLLENSLRQRDYSFDYGKQPSKAMFKYRRAFMRNDMKRYKRFMEDVSKGKQKLHTEALLPYEVVRPAMNVDCWGVCTSALSEDDRRMLDVTWNAMPDYTNGENALVVVDGSGSMYWQGNPKPAEVAMSLGMYFAERTKGAFHDHFITFSERPRLVEIKGRDVYERIRYCMSFNECANTNIRAVFELVLETAVKNHVPQEELPSTLYIISDMEFDSCAEGADISNFEYAKALYAEYGYELPKVVFWNVQSRNTQQPVRMNDRGVVLVSGASPIVFRQILPGAPTPYEQMLAILGSERYDAVCA